MNRTDVLKALQTAAIAAVGVSTRPTLPIKAMLRNFDIPNDNKYLELIDVPNDRTGEYWADGRTYQGSFRLILHWPIDDQGIYEPSGYIDELGSMFGKEKRFISGGLVVKIYDHPVNSGRVPNGSELLFPLVLPYRCFAL
jgi:hypothetical protein